jgi:hypothetical protein
MKGGENMMESVYYLGEMMRFEQRTIEKKARNVWMYPVWRQREETKKKTSAATLVVKKMDC